jgi:hypothetical protein
MKIEINTFDDLIEVIETKKLTPKQIIILVESTLQVFICPDDLENISEKLKSFWIEYRNKATNETPLFLTNPLNGQKD